MCTKTVTMLVEVRCPVWLTAAQARREVRTLINEQTFYGCHALSRSGDWDEIGDHNFRAKRVTAPPQK